MVRSYLAGVRRLIAMKGHYLGGEMVRGFRRLILELWLFWDENAV